MSICPNCQADNAEGSAFCSSCGTNLAPQPAVAPPPAIPTTLFAQQPGSSRVSGLAIASLVLSFIPLISFVGLIFGIVALVQIGNNQGPLRGRGLAIAGVCLSLFFPVFIIPALLFPVFAKSREKARQESCSSHQRQIAMAAMMYAQEHEDKFPASATFWHSIDVPPAVLVCPSMKTLANGYGLNNNLGGQKIGSLSNPSDMLLTADAVGAFDANLIQQVTDLDWRHDHGCIASYCDGHIAYLKAGTPIQLR